MIYGKRSSSKIWEKNKYKGKKIRKVRNNRRKGLLESKMVNFVSSYYFISFSFHNCFYSDMISHITVTTVTKYNICHIFGHSHSYIII